MATDVSEDYYALLGVNADADEGTLRRAFRRVALRWHPDRAGPSATATFQKISAAYHVLSDPLARAAYDRRRGTAARSSGGRSSAATSAPPTPQPRRAPGVMLTRVSGPLNALLACGVAELAEEGVIELFLNAQEATNGGMVTISMRVPVRCSACSPDATAPCSKCGGTRAIEELFSAWLAVPPEVTDGTILTPSVPLRGMLRPVSFRVRRR